MTIWFPVWALLLNNNATPTIKSRKFLLKLKLPGYLAWLIKPDTIYNKNVPYTSTRGLREASCRFAAAVFFIAPLQKAGFHAAQQKSPVSHLIYRATVPGTGIEPAHPCEYQILSLTRLPIPPSGL